MKNWNDLILQTVFYFFSFLFVFSIPVIFVFNGEYEKASLICLFSIVLILLMNFEKIESFKLWGMEAQLQKTIQEGQVTIEQVKALARAISKTSLTEIMAGNFLGGISLSERLKSHDLIVKELEDLGIDPKSMSEIKENWNKGICLIYDSLISHSLFGTIKDRLNLEYQRDRLPVAKEYQSMKDFSKWKAASVQQIKDFISKKKWTIDPHTQDLIDDYIFFEEEKEIRSKERLFGY